MNLYNLPNNICPNCLHKLTSNKQKVRCKLCKTKKCVFCHCKCVVDKVKNKSDLTKDELDSGAGKIEKRNRIRLFR